MEPLNSPLLKKGVLRRLGPSTMLDEENVGGHNSLNECSQDCDQFDFPLTQCPESSACGTQKTPSPFSSAQAPIQCSQSETSVKLFHPNLVTHLQRPIFGMDSDQLDNKIYSQKSSQVHGSQASPTFYGNGFAETDEITFCSQAHPVAYVWKTYALSTEECVPRYCKSVVKRFRDDDMALSPHEKLNEKQTPTFEEDRAIIVNWLIEMCPSLEISSKALYLAIKTFDRLSAVTQIKQEEFPLWGAACLSIAAKMENSFYPQLSSYVRLSESQFTENQLIETELKLLSLLNYQVNSATIVLYLKLWLNEIDSDSDFAFTTSFIGLCALTSLELAKMDSELVALACICTALNARKKDIHNPVLKSMDLYSTERLTECATILNKAVKAIALNYDSPIRQLFSVSERGCVATKYSFDVPKF